jgi:hypothetical protein
MQEEVKKHTKNIFKVVKSDHSFRKKAKEVFVEVLIIVFAVSISIYLHGWSAHRHEQKEVRVFLTNLREDLVKDIENLKSDKDVYMQMNKRYKDVLNLTEFQLDSTAKVGNKVNIPFHVFGNKINNGNYEGFKTSGKIGYIENEHLKKKILAYYQKDVLDIIEMDKLYTQFVVTTIDFQVNYVSKTDKEKYLDPKFRERIGLLIGLGENNIEGYRYVIKNISKIVKEIDNELK